MATALTDMKGLFRRGQSISTQSPLTPLRPEHFNTKNGLLYLLGFYPKRPKTQRKIGLMRKNGKLF